MHEALRSCKNAAYVVAIVWAVYIVGLFLPFQIQNLGIHPRSLPGLLGIITAPFIHANMFHLLANTVALLVLLAIALIHDRETALVAIMIIMVIAGMGTWMFGTGNSVHVGASSIIFGLIGYLLLIGWYRRDVKSLVVSFVVFFLYGGAMVSLLIPIAGVSWSGHFFGFVGGACAARWLAKT